MSRKVFALIALCAIALCTVHCGGGACKNPNPNYDSNDLTSEPCLDSNLMSGNSNPGGSNSTENTASPPVLPVPAFPVDGAMPEEVDLESPDAMSSMPEGSSSDLNEWIANDTEMGSESSPETPPGEVELDDAFPPEGIAFRMDTLQIT